MPNKLPKKNNSLKIEVTREQKYCSLKHGPNRYRGHEAVRGRGGRSEATRVIS